MIIRTVNCDVNRRILPDAITLKKNTYKMMILLLKIYNKCSTEKDFVMQIIGKRPIITPL